MATQAGADVYGRRKLIERINANLKNHGFGFIPVRGLDQGHGSGALACARQ